MRVCCSRVNGEIANKCANVKGKIYANVSGQIYTNINDQIYANVNCQIYANVNVQIYENINGQIWMMGLQKCKGTPTPFIWFTISLPNPPFSLSLSWEEKS